MPASDFVLPGTNTRLRPFPFRLEFPITESREYVTNVISADDGTEQRIAARNPAHPRQHIAAHVIAFERDELAHLKALLFGWSLQLYGVPLWIHLMQLVDDASATDTSLTVDDCDGRDLDDRLSVEADVPVLLWSAHDDWEPAILASADDGTLTLKSPLARDWPSGTLVLPMRPMLVSAEPVELTARARAIAELDLEFVSTEYPLSPNSCSDVDDDATRVLLVRGAGADSAFVVAAAPADGSGTPDAENMGGLHPQSSDPDHDLFGFNETIVCSMTTQHGMNGRTPAPPMYPKSKGRATGFTRCTPKAPSAFFTEIHARGLGSTVGDDCFLNVYGAYPAGLDPDGNPPIVSSGFSGSGFFPSVGAPGSGTHRELVVASMTLHGGLARGNGATEGSVVSSYGRYDVSVPGGIRSFPLSPEGSLTPNSVVLSHGFCVRCAKVDAWKGIKVVAEAVLYDDDGHETGDFADAIVVTHDFSSDDYTAANGVEGFFQVLACGSDTIFGNAHMENGSAPGGHIAEGYNDLFDTELFRVTVYLIDAADAEHQQWQDIFPTMFVSAAVSP